jgi:hypothetical protein
MLLKGFMTSSSDCMECDYSEPIMRNIDHLSSICDVKHLGSSIKLFEDIYFKNFGLN